MKLVFAELFIERWRERLRSSLWFIPGVGAASAFVAVQALVAVDRLIGPERRAWFLFSGPAESARELLSTIASSMLTFTGLVFSITIVVLQLASAQFSPRVVQTFLADRHTHVAMAMFVGTFVFALALLPSVRPATNGEPAFVPGLSLFVAFALVLGSVGMFIHYIDHIAQSVRAINLVKRIGAETRQVITRVYPEDVLRGADPTTQQPDPKDASVIENPGPGGVVSAVNQHVLLDLACAAEAIVAVVPMLGDYVPHGAPLLRVWGSLDRDVAVQAVDLEEERTAHQDPAFGFRQLVDIAERALSPAVNDPSTAVQVLDEIHDLLRALATVEFPSPLRADDDGRLRLILPRPEWDDYVRLGLDEIRQYGTRSIQVARRMRAMIEDLQGVVRPERRAVLDLELRLLEEAVRHGFRAPVDQATARKPSAQGHGDV